jgi:hypothetical protein
VRWREDLKWKARPSACCSEAVSNARRARPGFSGCQQECDYERVRNWQNLTRVRLLLNISLRFQVKLKIQGDPERKEFFTFGDQTLQDHESLFLCVISAYADGVFVIGK